MNNESSIAVEVATHVDDGLVGAVHRLVSQLTSSPPPPTRVELEVIVAGPSTMLLLARSGSAVVGMLTLAIFRIPTGIRAWIEDVVVDSTSLRATAPDTFVLSVVLRSRSTVPLVMPSVDLALTDATGRLVARRVLSPRDFTAADVLAPQAETPLQVLLTAGPSSVVGYTVEIFYP